jgi:hypothetical protein
MFAAGAGAETWTFRHANQRQGGGNAIEAGRWTLVTMAPIGYPCTQIPALARPVIVECMLFDAASAPEDNRLLLLGPGSPAAACR